MPGFVCEFNITKGLWTSRVTSHVPIRDVAALITGEGVCRRREDHRRGAAPGRHRAAADRGVGAQSACGRRRLDRHGRDRDHRARPCSSCRPQGLDARGPFSPDTVFIAARRGDFDAVVSMYHDQGQIAMKLMGFEQGVTLHGGLPIPVATSASGSAFDIAGRGIAQIEGLQHAFDLCVRMARAARQSPYDSRQVRVSRDAARGGPADRSSPVLSRLQAHERFIDDCFAFAFGRRR